MHALERIRSRKISPDVISRCIETPNRVIVERDITKNVMKIDNNVLIVVFKKENNRIVVITAYRSSRVEKYLNLSR